MPPGKEKLLHPLLAARKFSLFVLHTVTTPTRLQEHHVTSKLEAFLLLAHQQATKEASRSLLCAHSIDYFAYVARPGASARRATRHAARPRLLQLRRASGCLGTSRGSSRGSSCRPSLTSSPTSRVRVPRHVARLVVDFYTYATRPGASACHAALH
jgi:hypothetical protein